MEYIFSIGVRDLSGDSTSPLPKKPSELTTEESFELIKQLIENLPKEQRVEVVKLCFPDIDKQANFWAFGKNTLDFTFTDYLEEQK